MCPGVFTDHSIFQTILARVLDFILLLQEPIKYTRKDNLSVILSSLPLSHRFVLSPSWVIH